MSIFNPWVLLGIVMAVLSAFGTGYWSGKDAEYTRQQAEIASLNAKARETEQRMAEVANTYAQTLRKANDVARIKETKLRADLADGSLKLRIPVKTVCPVSVSESSAPASGSDSGAASAELDRQTAETLIAIAAEGDAAIRKLNTCIEQYNQVRSAK
jgi:cobalamin biosynthesis Mg chelatase CobN